MPYIINKTDGTPLVTLNDGTVDTTTSVGLIGRNYVGYGEIQNENFLFLLENFANTTAPSRPITGQTWFDTSTKALNVYTGQTWVPVSSAIISNTEPVSMVENAGAIGNGLFWFKSSTNQLYLYNDGEWKLVGPNGLEGYGITNIVADTVVDTNLTEHAILKAFVDDNLVAIISKSSFRINSSNSITGFLDINAGITLSSGFSVGGTLIGNASTASRLETPRSINGVSFSGASDITITSATTGSLTNGSYIVGGVFNGSTNQTWSVDATSSNVTNKVVVRDQNGDFSARNINANIIGSLSGNVTANSGTSKFDIVEVNEIIGLKLTGNSVSASKLLTARQINGVLFDGTRDITVPVSGLDVSGTRLAANVKESELTSLGILSSLRIQAPGITIGSHLQISTDQNSNPLISSAVGTKIRLTIADSSQANSTANFEFLNSAAAFAAGGFNAPTIVGDVNSKTNIGLPSRKFGTIYADNLEGTASSALYADLAENYVSDAQYEPGTVLEFGGEFEVTVADNESPRVAGVVSKNPAYLMNSDCNGEFVVAIALQGRVPCKVQGKVKKGDIIVSAGNGYAKSSETPRIGTVIGKSLENFDGIEGVIEVAVGRI